MGFWDRGLLLGRDSCCSMSASESSSSEMEVWLLLVAVVAVVGVSGELMGRRGCSEARDGFSSSDSIVYDDAIRY